MMIKTKWKKSKIPLHYKKNVDIVRICRIKNLFHHLKLLNLKNNEKKIYIY